MRNVAATAACLAVFTLFSGCSKDKNGTDSPKPITVANSEQLTQTVYADKTTGASAVQISTTGAWTSSIAETTATRAAAPSWISISPSSGNQAGDYTIAISVEPNLTGADRTATVSITCEGSTTTITLTQKKENEDGIVPVAVTGVSLNKSELTFVVGESFTLEAVVAPADATNKTLTWTSSNPDVVSVGFGILTAIALGDAIITVTTADGEKTATCAVTVAVDEISEISMTTTANAVNMRFPGFGPITINWGDGNSETVTARFTTASHSYTSSGSHIITITGANIMTVECMGNQLSALDLSKNTALKSLRCYNNQLTTLDFSNNTVLTDIECNDNQLTALDVSNNTALGSLVCYNNQLTALDVSNNTALGGLSCYNNQLTALDVSKNTALGELWCGSNQLTSLDVSNNTALRYFACDYNQLSALDVSNNTELWLLWCNDNQLSASALDALFQTLHSNLEGIELIIIDNPGADDCDRSIATAKGWVVQ
jgi:hypothetical protein